MQVTRRLICLVGMLLVAVLLAGTVASVWAQDFKLVHRPRIHREMVWFNGREGDLEWAPFVKQGRMYVALIDLMRHIGGTIASGPPRDFIEVERNKMLVRVLPGKAQVLVNGVTTDIGQAPEKHHGALYVPLRAFDNLFGVATQWNRVEHRAYVTFRNE